MPSYYFLLTYTSSKDEDGTSDAATHVRNEIAKLDDTKKFKASDISDDLKDKIFYWEKELGVDTVISGGITLKGDSETSRIKEAQGIIKEIFRTFKASSGYANLNYCMMIESHGSSFIFDDQF